MERGFMTMKKVNAWYLLKWIAGIFLAGIILMVMGVKLPLDGFGDNLSIFFMLAGLVVWGSYGALPGILETKMGKRALELEQLFSHNGFSFQYKYSSHNGIFYIGTDRRLGVIWKCNPFVLQFIDSSKITDIRTNTGEILVGTSSVCCEFRVDGKKYKIYTLRASKEPLSMKDPRVTEAVKKADGIGRRIELCRHDTNYFRGLGEVRENEEKYTIANATRQDMILAVQRFKANKSTHLLLGTEQCSLSLCTVNVEEGFCAVMLTFKHRGEWKVLRCGYTKEQGAALFITCYDEGIVSQDFSQWEDVSQYFRNRLEDDKRRAEDLSRYPFDVGRQVLDSENFVFF